MNATYSDRVKRGEGLALLQQASAVLEEVIGPPANRVGAEWDQAENGSRPVYTLRLIDGPEEVTASFTADDLRSPRELRYRLIRLWGDLLELRSHRQLKELVSAGSEAGE